MASIDHQNGLETAREGFDPYHKWLGIPPDEQPPNLYRLLGIRPFESDPDVISNAADGRMYMLRGFQTGQYSALSQKLLNEVSAARVCLLNAERKQVYDRGLQESTVETVKIDDGPVRHGLEPLQPPPIQIDHAAATRRVVSNGQNGTRKNTHTLLIAGAAAGAVVIGGAAVYMATRSDDREENGKKVHRMTQEDLASTTHGQPKLPEVPAFDRTSSDKRPTETAVPPEEPARTQEKQPEIEANPPEPQQPEQVTSVNRGIQDIEKKPPETDVNNPFEPESKMSDEVRRALVAQILASAEQEGQKYEGSKDGCAKLLQHAKTEPDLTKRTALALAAAYVAAQQRSLPALNEAIAYAQKNSIGFMTHDEILQYQLSLLRSVDPKDMSNEDRASQAMELLGSLQAAYREENFELAEALLRQAHLYAYGENGHSRVWQGKKEFKEKGAPVIEAVDEALGQLKESIALYRGMQAGLGTDGQPQDSAAHFTMGVYLAKVQGDWNGALGHFSQGNNPHVAKAAEMDRASPTDAAGMFAVGKAWMKAGEVVQEGEICFERAWMWYNKAKNMNPGGKVGLDIEGELRGLRGKGVGVGGEERPSEHASSDVPTPKNPETLDATTLPISGFSIYKGDKIDIGVNQANSTPIIDGNKQKRFVFVHAPGQVKIDISALPEAPYMFEAILHLDTSVKKNSDGIVWSVSLVQGPKETVVYHSEQSVVSNEVRIPIARNTDAILVRNHPGSQNDITSDWGFVIKPTLHFRK